MPELPEVETVRQTLLKPLVGKRIVRVWVRNIALRKKLLDKKKLALATGLSILNIRRRAKYLLIDLENRNSLLIHLGMSGRLLLESHPQDLATHDHVVFYFDSNVQLRYWDARRFGMVELIETCYEHQHPSLSKLGIEPLDSGKALASALYEKSRRKTQSIKNFLLDARYVVGIGNIYASEALFQAHIHPAMCAGELSEIECRELAQAVVATLKKSLAAGGSSFRDFRNAYGQKGFFVQKLKVYGREGLPCWHCKAPIERFVQAGRSTFFCNHCQKTSKKLSWSLEPVALLKSRKS